MGEGRPKAPDPARVTGRGMGQDRVTGGGLPKAPDLVPVTGRGMGQDRVTGEGLAEALDLAPATDAVLDRDRVTDVDPQKAADRSQAMDRLTAVVRAWAWATGAGAVMGLDRLKVPDPATVQAMGVDAVTGPVRVVTARSLRAVQLPALPDSVQSVERGRVRIDLY